MHCIIPCSSTASPLSPSSSFPSFPSITTVWHPCKQREQTIRICLSASCELWGFALATPSQCISRFYAFSKPCSGNGPNNSAVLYSISKLCSCSGTNNCASASRPGPHPDNITCGLSVGGSVIMAVFRGYMEVLQQLGTIDLKMRRFLTTSTVIRIPQPIRTR